MRGVRVTHEYTYGPRGSGRGSLGSEVVLKLSVIMSDGQLLVSILLDHSAIAIFTLLTTPFDSTHFPSCLFRLVLSLSLSLLGTQ